jgi:hypothetical protein
LHFFQLIRTGDRKPDAIPAFNREITKLFAKTHAPLAHANGRRR